MSRAKTLFVILVVCLVLAMPASSSVKHGNLTESSCTMVLPIPDSARAQDSSVSEYSRQHFLARLMQVESLDLKTAEARLLDIENLAEGQYSYWELKSLYDYGNGYVVEAGVLYLMRLPRSQEISGIVGKWTAARVGADYTWNESYYVLGWTPTQITQLVRGRVSASVNIRSLRGVLQKNRMLRSGFQPGTVWGGIWHTAKVSSWGNIFTVDSALQGVR